jgi:hypothetical protein
MTLKVLHRIAVCCTVLIAGAWASSAAADTALDVTINTGTVSGGSGSLVFDFVTNNPGGNFNTVKILTFATNGTLGLPQTQGGLVSGDLILGANPAAFTTIESSFAFNELLLPYSQFGTSTTFSLDISGFAPNLGIPDEFSLFLLDTKGNPLFPTSDPLGADSLLTVDVTGAAGGAVNVFSPASLSGQNVQINVPGPSTVPEPSSLLLIASALFLMVAHARKIFDRVGRTRPRAHETKITYA